MIDPDTSVQAQRIQEIADKLAVVKAALAEDGIDVWNRAHHASWSDLEYLLAALSAAEAQRAALETLVRDCKQREKVCANYAAQHQHEGREVARQFHLGAAEAFRDTAKRLREVLDAERQA